MTIGEKIRLSRTKKKMSQDELSKRTGVAQRLISGYEQDKITPSTDVVKKIAEVFGVTTDYLLYGDEKEGTVEDRELLRYMSIIDKMEDEDKKYVKRFLRSMITDTKVREVEPPQELNQSSPPTRKTEKEHEKKIKKAS